MEALVQCPVCTLYLHQGMGLDVHLDTHPKDQVIRALCRFARPSSRASSRSRAASPASLASDSAPSPLQQRDSQLLVKSEASQYIRQIPSGLPLNFAIPNVNAFGTNQKNIIITGPLPMTDSNGNKNCVPLICNNLTAIDSKSFSRSSPLSGCPPQIVYKKIVNEPQKLNFSPILTPTSKYCESAPKPLTAFQNVMVFQPYSETNSFPGSDSVGKFDGSSFVRHPANLSSYQTNYANLISKTPILINETSVSQSSGRKYVSMQNLPSADVHPDVSLLEIPKLASTPTSTSTSNASESNGKLRGLRILSNVKIEPIHNNFPSDAAEYGSISDRTEPDVTEPDLDEDEAILPDLDEVVCDSYSRSEFSDGNYSTTDSVASSAPAPDISVEDRPIEDGSFSKSGFRTDRTPNTFSVIKNVGNPNPFKDIPSAPRSPKPEIVILPDLTCQEKPSISPCDNSTNDSIDISKTECNASAKRVHSPELRSLPRNKHSLPAMISKNFNKKDDSPKKPKNANPKNLKLKNGPLEKFDQPSSSIMCDESTERYVDIDKTNSSSFSYCPDGFFKEIDDARRTRRFDTSLRKETEDFSAKLECKLIDVEGDSSHTNMIDDEKMEICHLNHPDSLGNDDVKELPYQINYSEKNGQYTQTLEYVQNQYDDPIVRPVNVIAFGSINLTTGANANIERSQSSFNLSETPIASNLEENVALKSSNDNLYMESSGHSSNFTIAKDSLNSSVADEDMIDNGVHKKEFIPNDEDRNKDNQYDWLPQKDEFPFTNFMQCNYNQNIYQKINECIDEKEIPNVVRKDYTELICPRDGYSDVDRKKTFLDSLETTKISADETEALNIRTDERMPPRGELSEQESSGDMDAPWAGMYHDMGGSTSYDLLARDSWPSDGSDVDMPASPLKHNFNENDNEIEDIPIVISVKPPDRNYKCATCGKAFNCPKERRVHRSKEHSSTPTPNAILERKLKRKQMLIKTNIKIKNEKIIKTECVITSTQVNLLQMENRVGEETITIPNQLDIKPVKPDIGAIELIENKPLLDFVKFEAKRKKQSHTCDTCKAEFATDALYQEHMKIHPLECLTCGKLFNKRANLKLHIKRHLGIKNHRCDICEKRFITKQKLVEHYNIHTGMSPIKCNLCDLTFRRYSNMTQHRNRHHFHIKKRLRDFVCVCGEVFHSKKKLAWHKEIHDDKPKACSHCNEKFVHTASLTRHMRRTHNNYFVSDENKKSLNVQCPECNLVYLKSSIEMHMKTHTGVKPFSCVICNKSFTTKWNLKLHKWTHANRSSKPFKCALCKGAFMRQTDYVSHMNAHKAVRPYTCNHCGCQFIRKYNCQRHVKEHETEKKFVCEVPDCGKSFHRSYYLTEHLKVHSGIRPYSCNICGKTSSTKSNHNKHVKIHHAREPVTTEG